MKGLLIKDWKLMKNQRMFFLAIIIMTFFLHFSGAGTVLLTSYLPFVLSIFTMSSISYDEMDHGMSFLMVMPVTRKDYVAEKYIFGFLLGISGLLLGAVLSAVIHLSRHSALDFERYLIEYVCTAGFLAVFLAIMIPVQLKFGSEKGRIVLLGAFLGVIGIVYAVSAIMEDLPQSLQGLAATVSSLPKESIFLLFAALTLCILAVSFGISLHVMKKKEF